MKTSNDSPSEVSLDRQAVTLWMVIYNHDCDQCYFFTDPDATAAAVVRSVMSYTDSADDGAFAAGVAEFRQQLVLAYLQFTIGGLAVSVQRLELDRHDRVHGLLVRVLAVLDRLGPADPEAQLLRRQIAGLFCPPATVR